MRSKGLVVMAVAGSIVVGYAFYTLLESGSSRPEIAKRSGRKGGVRVHPSAEADDDRGSHRPRPPVARPAVRVSPPPPANDAVDAADAVGAAPTPGLPPRPKPEISLEQARKDFADFMAELERVEQQGARLTSPEWVDYYKRGHDALLPLQQHLDWTVPDQADELRRANDDMRTKLQTLEPREPVAPTSP